MGQGIADGSSFLNMLNGFAKTREIRLIPSNLISDDSKSQMDEEELTVLHAKQPKSYSETFSGAAVIRSVEPIIASENCFECHESKAGDTYAVLSIRSSIADANAQKFRETMILLNSTITAYYTFYILKFAICNFH